MIHHRFPLAVAVALMMACIAAPSQAHGVRADVHAGTDLVHGQSARASIPLPPIPKLITKLSVRGRPIVNRVTARIVKREARKWTKEQFRDWFCGKFYDHFGQDIETWLYWARRDRTSAYALYVCDRTGYFEYG
jgi:hypothetical protein